MSQFMSSDPTYPFFPIMTFLGFILPLIPLAWHFQAWNSGTCYYMMWASLACLNQFVNSVTWKGNAINWAPVWCDISIRIIMASSVGLPAASLCINRRLYKITQVQGVSATPKMKRRGILIDTLICVAFPLVLTALQFIVQGHRFNIFEDIGCVPAYYNTIPTYFLATVWPIIIGLISAVYCILSLRAFLVHRLAFSQFLAGSHSSLTQSRYFRLMALACTEILFTTPFAVFVLYLNVTAQPVEPWRGIADAHFNFSRVETYLAIVWRSNKTLEVSTELSRWFLPLCSLTFFAFFGFAEEAKKNYKAWYNKVAATLHIPLLRSNAWSPSRKIQYPEPLKSHQLSSSYPASTTLYAPSSPPSYYDPKSPNSIMDIKIPSGHISYYGGQPVHSPSPSTSSKYSQSTSTGTRFHEDLPRDSIPTYYERSTTDFDAPPSPSFTITTTAATMGEITPTTETHFIVPQLPLPPVVYGSESFSPIPSPGSPRRGWAEDLERGMRPLTYPYPEFAPRGIREPNPENFP